MFQALAVLPHQRWPWAMLFCCAAGLMVAAMAFQHLFQWPPCVLCIYIRVAVCAVALAALVAMLSPANRLCQGIGWLGWGSASVWGASLSLELIDKQDPNASQGLFGASCDFLPNFPTWMPLHQWWPEGFMPTGDCTAEPWVWLGLSMAQWTLVAFSLFLLAWGVVALACLADWFGIGTRQAAKR